MPRFLSTRPGLRTAVVCALLFGATVLLFSRALQCDFVNYDDPGFVTENPHVQGGLSWAGVVWAFTAPTDYWRPLTWLSHMLDWDLHGSSPAGHHLTSVLWHALNAALAFLVFRRLGGGSWMSAFAAAVFAWHPLRVESVVWVTERKDVLSGCFFLLTLLAYAGYVGRRQDGRPWRASYLLTLACFAAGLMSKPMLVTLPLLLLVLDWWPFGRVSRAESKLPAGSTSSNRDGADHPFPDRAPTSSLPLLLLEKLPFFVLSGVASVVTVLMQRHDGAFVLDLSLGARAGNAVVSLARYLGKFFWPHDLIVCYPHPGSWPAVAVVAASVLALGLGLLAWQQRRARPWIAAGWLWFLVVLLPVIGLVQVGFQAMADRYTYLPLLGIELALFWSLRPALLSSRARIGAILAAVAILGALGARTWDQQGVWRDSVSLFEHAVAASPDNGFAEDFLASALFAAGRFDEAAVHAERACALLPHNDTAFVSLASIRETQGRSTEAIALYRKALALRPENPAVQMQLGLLLLRQNHVDEARRMIADALRAAPGLRGRTLEIGYTALQRGDPTTARFLLELMIAITPHDAEAHVGMGAVHLARNDPGGAIVHLRAATARDPALADAQLALARCAEQLGRSAEATAALGRALAAAPDDASIHFGAMETYARLGDFASAIRVGRRAVELAPTASAPHAALGYLLIHTGDRAGGLAAWRRALELDPNLPGLRERILEMTPKP